VALVLNVRGGVRMCVPEELGEAATYVLLEQEDWMEDEIRFVRRWLKQGMRGIDVGANYGVYAAAMAKAVGPGGRVWAFEPTPAVCELLQKTFDLNEFSHAVLTRAAVSNRPGALHLAMKEVSALNQIASARAAGSVEVPAVTLDGMAAEHGWGGVDFIKIDVEGHEAQVIAGGAALLASASPLVMLEIVHAGAPDSAGARQLEEMGYSLYRLVPGLLMLAPCDGRAPVDDFQVNAFACKPDRAAQLAAEGALAPSDTAWQEKPRLETWLDYARSAPYARRLAQHWRARPGFFSGGGQSDYYDALASFAGSRDVAAGAAQRLGWLRRAYERVHEALAAASTLSRLVSLARIAADLGLRQEAFGALRDAMRRAREEAAGAQSEPFLAPSARSERIEADTALFAWLDCALREQLDKQRVFSSLYDGANTQTLLEPVFANPCCAPESERRRQLVAMLAGRQAGPQPHALLREASEENLNPDYWRGKA
jgi:FkbM family methyltransferase